MNPTHVQYQPRAGYGRQPERQSSKGGQSNFPTGMVKSLLKSGGAEGTAGAESSTAALSNPAANPGAGFANPMTALAVLIAGNEIEATRTGRRSSNPVKHFTDLTTGKTFTDDMDYFGGKVGGPGGEAIKLTGKMSSPEGWLDLIKELF